MSISRSLQTAAPDMNDRELSLSRSETESPPLLYAIGSWSPVLLALILPFELTQRPLFQDSVLTLTNLKAVWYPIAALAAIMLLSLAATDRQTAARYCRQQSVPIALLLALLASSVVSSLMGSHPQVGLKWTVDLALGALIWLVMPVWLRDMPRRRGQIVAAIVLGAVVAAFIGLLEFVLGFRFAEALTWFKAKPSTIGPFLRLSGTFQYTNIAAAYLEMAVPFACGGLLHAILHARRGLLTPLMWASFTVVLLTAEVLTASRGALLGLAAACFMVLIVLKHQDLLHAGLRCWCWFAGVLAGAVLLSVILAMRSHTPFLLRLTTQSDLGWYRAAYSAAPPTTIQPNQLTTFPLTVTNLGPIAWSARGAFRYDLGYHWLTLSHRTVVFDSIRTPLPRPVPPGGRITLAARIMGPPRPGRYLLVLDMAEEGVTWFSVKTGQYTVYPVQVAGRSVGPAAVGGRARAVSPLPAAPAQPERRQLWSVALRMLWAHPIWGAGPDSYRLSYGDFTVPRLRSWDTRIYANSLPLELFADLGLIGGGLFFLFLLVVIWPLVRGTISGGALYMLPLFAAIVAFLIHGTVDYLLGSHAIFILFWILLGLISAWYRPLDQAPGIAG